MFEQVTEPLMQRYHQVKVRVTRSVFGANNERIDFLMDSFYKLEANQRAGVLAGIGIGAVVIVIIIFGVYFARVSALESQLEEGFQSIYQLQAQKRDYQAEVKRFDALVDNIRRKTQSLAIKPFIEKTAKSVNVSVQDLSERRADLPAEIVLSEQLKYVHATVDLSKVSIPRLLKFLVEIEKSNSFLGVEDLEIRARYQDSLYFDARAKVRGYVVER